MPLNRLSTCCLAALLALAGVAGSASPAAADEIRLGMPAKMFLNLVEYVARDKGFYEAEDLEVEFVQIADSSVPVRSLIAGGLEVSEAGMSETLTSIAKGAELKTIGGVHTGLHYAVWVNSHSGIDSIEDLPGKKVGISSPGSLPHVVILALLHQAGVPQEQIDTITWVSVKGSSARRNAVIAGTIDATVASYNPKAERDPNADVLFVAAERLPNYVMTPWDVRAETIEENPELLKRFIRAELKATRWIFDHEAETLEFAKTYFDYSDEDLKAFYHFYRDRGIWDPNGIVTPEQAAFMQELNVQGGLQDEVLPAERVLDTHLLEEVLDEIGRYKEQG